MEKIDFKSRLNISQLDYNKYFKDTPLASWYTSNVFKKSHWVLQNLGNAFRLAALWKLGGIYMDMDIIVLNSVKGRILGRTAAREDTTRVNNAVLCFPSKDPFIWASMEVFVNNFQGYSWFFEW